MSARHVRNWKEGEKNNNTAFLFCIAGMRRDRTNPNASIKKKEKNYYYFLFINLRCLSVRVCDCLFC